MHKSLRLLSCDRRTRQNLAYAFLVSCIGFCLPAHAINLLDMWPGSRVEITVTCPGGGAPLGGTPGSVNTFGTNAQVASVIFGRMQNSQCTAAQGPGVAATENDVISLIDNAASGASITLKLPDVVVQGQSPTYRAWINFRIVSFCTEISGQFTSLWRSGTVAQYNTATSPPTVTPSWQPFESACIHLCRVYVTSGAQALYTNAADAATFGQGSSLHVLYNAQVSPEVCTPAAEDVGTDRLQPVNIVLAQQGGGGGGGLACIDENNDNFDDEDGSLCVPVCEDEDNDGRDDETGKVCGLEQQLALVTTANDLAREIMDGEGLTDFAGYLPGSLLLPASVKAWLTGTGSCNFALSNITVADLTVYMPTTDVCAAKAPYDGIYSFGMYVLSIFVAWAAYRFAVA